MTVEFIMRMPGGICYAHGPYQTWVCPKLPACDTDQKHLEYLELAGVPEEDYGKILGLDCYCVCHSPYSSNVYCEHCKGDNEVSNRYRERNRLKEEVIHQAKDFFGSTDRNDASKLLEAVGALLIHETS